MKILGYIMAKNEWPLLGLSVINALDNFVDHLIVVDHNSTDDTHTKVLLV